MTLMQQANELKLYQRDHVDPKRNHPGRHLGIQAILSYEVGDLRFDLRSLDFLSTPAEQQLLFELTVEERRYMEALKAINARSDLLVDEVQPKLMAAGFDDGAEYTSGQFIAALGQPVYNKLKRLTDDVIYHVDRTSDSICEMKDKFRSAVIKRYPEASFINFEFPDGSSTAA
jgi:hypothetical protein